MSRPLSRRRAALASLALAVGISAAAAEAATPITVTFAGSMGVVMDKDLGPTFDKANGTRFQGVGKGAWGLARLIDAKKQPADVFVSVTPGPMQLLIKDHRVTEAVPVASTQMVIAYNPKSPHAADFEAAAAGKMPWYKVLAEPGVEFGRTDPAVDPGGRNTIFTMLLAEKYYNQPGLADSILHGFQNSEQISAEEGTLARLEAGQIDATTGYRAAILSQHLPFITLPDAINLSDPAVVAEAQKTVHPQIKDADGKTETLDVEPLVYFAGVLADAEHPEEAKKFVAFLQSPEGQKILQQDGYDAPKGGTLN